MAETFNKELAAKVKNVQENLKTDVCKCCEEGCSEYEAVEKAVEEYVDA